MALFAYTSLTKRCTALGRGPMIRLNVVPTKKRGIKFADRQRAFAEMLAEMDKGVGEILDKLVELNIDKNTFVFFLSDNGPAGGSAGPLRGRKGSNWEGGHRVPGIAWWPETIAPGKTTDELGISLDLMPTMLSLAGMEAPAGHRFDGMDLSALLKDGKLLAERSLFWEGPNPKSMIAMRRGVWKLMMSHSGEPKVVGLFDLSKDIGEKTDLSQLHPEKVKAMQDAYHNWHEEVTRDATPQRNEVANP